MKATEVMLVGIALGVIGRWAHNEKAVPSASGMVEIVGAVVLISFLDQGKTAPIAQGLSWLFLASLLLGKNSILSALPKSKTPAYTPSNLVTTIF